MKNNGISKVKIFKPRQWRWFFFHWPINTTACILGGTIAAVLLGRHPSSGLIPGLVIGSAFIHFVFSRHTDTWSVTITEHEILGSWKKGNRIIIQIEEIDRSKSFKKTLLGKLFGFDHIFSKVGQRIYVESISLGRDQVAQIRSILKT